MDMVSHYISSRTIFSNSDTIINIFIVGDKTLSVKLVKLNNGEEIIIVQIAGLIARRIVCEVEQDQDLKQGERIGMIRFGSRVDIYFKNKKVLAKLDEKRNETCAHFRKQKPSLP